MKKLKKVKKRIWVLLGTLFVLILTNVIIILGFGSHFIYEYLNILYNYPVYASELSYEVEPNDIIEIERVYVNDSNNVCMEVNGLNSGKISGTVYCAGLPMEFDIYVTPLKTVIDMRRINFTGYRFLEYSLLFALVLIAAVMVASYIECITKARYSYSMAAYGGIGLFALALFVYTFFRMLDDIGFRDFLYDFTDTCVYFVYYVSPYFFLLCLMLSVSNLWLIRHEGFRPINLLGVFLGVFWVAGFLLVISRGFSFELVSVSADVAAWAYYLSCALAYIISMMVFLMFSVTLSAFLSTKFRPPYDKDYLIILGCGIRKDGTLTPLLKGRADAALEFEKKQFAATGRHAKFVPSGGQGSDEVISESEAIKCYLVSQGIPENMILKEDKSVNTDQNIKFSRNVIEKDAGTLDGVKAAFATTNYHIFRGYVLSQKHGLDAQGLSAKTRWYFYPNAFLREFIGLIVDKKWYFTAVILSIALLFTAISFFTTMFPFEV